jgi:hypothetical protein
MMILWEFETVEKLARFCRVLTENSILFETGKSDSAINQLTLSVAKSDYVNAKKLLMKFRKRKTTK